MNPHDDRLKFPFLPKMDHIKARKRKFPNLFSFIIEQRAPRKRDEVKSGIGSNLVEADKMRQFPWSCQVKRQWIKR